MHLAEDGEGPLVVLCHGYPELWYSWRHQLKALAEAGYHVVAPDQRGYGQTDRPEAVEDYNILQLSGDIIGLVDALGETGAVIVGHDWGAAVAWHCALLRPDIFRAVVLLSVPYLRRSWADIRPDFLRLRPPPRLPSPLHFWFIRAQTLRVPASQTRQTFENGRLKYRRRQSGRSNRERA